MMTREEALSRIRMNPKMVPAGQDPEAFIAAMMAADAANSAPMTPPVEVSPAEPAPVQAGVPIVAPPPMAPPMPPMATDFRNQAVLAANQTRPPGTDLISGNSGQDVLLGSAGKDVVVPPAPAAPPAVAPPKLTRTPEEMQALVQNRVDAIAKARQGASIPEEMKSYFDAISQRTDAELADVGKERKQQYWMALALAGAKMAQSQSPYFATALAEGLESGLTGFNKARADASEKKARLQTRKEDLILKRYEVLKSAQRDAVAEMKAGREMTAADLEMMNSSDEQLLRAATAGATVRAAEAQAKTAESGAKYADETARAGLGETKARTSYYFKQGSLIDAQIGKLRSDVQRAKDTGGLDAATASVIDSYMASADKLQEAAIKARRDKKNPDVADALEARAKTFFDAAVRLTPQAPGAPAAAPTAANPLGLPVRRKVEPPVVGD